MAKTKQTRVHGWVVLDKPLGLTSTQALGRARRFLGGTKVGHGGTLDPLATGVLPLAFGEATKLIPYVLGGDKEYTFTVQWGEARSTDDAEGDVIARSDIRPTEEEIRQALPAFVGPLMQKPPAFSAIKIQGERAYTRARSGEAVDLPPREIVVKSFDLIDIPNENSASFCVSCGKGTYIRALARDLALHLGTYGFLSALRRTKAASFSLDQAVSMDDLERSQAENDHSAVLLPIKAGLSGIPTLTLTPQEAHSLRLGQKILIKPHYKDLLDAPVVFAEYGGSPVALIEPFAGEFRVLRGFHF
ncbi:MAG: tRNA pseudouridine(55) synthase TruB [Alphaproteobacteria bacterium]|nr:tRNA pseudouridine(55) synthase TruB [Alphaproteobacteria bacterium]